MPRVGDMFQGTYLKAADLQGRKVLLTIESVDMESIGQGKDAEDKWVVKFKGKEKGLVLNVTNANMIAEIIGDDRSEQWPSHQIVLYPSKTDFAGKRVDCIRVEYPPKGSARKPEPEPEPEPLTDDSEEPPF